MASRFFFLITRMTNTEVLDFIDALERYVADQLRQGAEPPEYNPEALQIVDARNHLFVNVGRRDDDEEHDIFTLRALCCIDEQTLEVVPNRQRLGMIARHYFD